MVEIQPVDDNEETNLANSANETKNENTSGKSEKANTSKTQDGWEKLMGEDLLMKVIEKGTPAGGKAPEAVNPQDAVLVDLVGRVAPTRDDTEGPIVQEAKGWLVVVGEGDVLPCVEMAIRFMETGQRCRVWSSSKFAFGGGTRSYVDGTTGEKACLTPGASIMFEIKVTMIVMDTSRLNPYFTLQKAVTRKNMANDIYQYEWCKAPKAPGDPSCEMSVSRSLRLYTKVAKDMETLLEGTYFQQVEADHPQRQQTRQLLMDCLNNIVAVYLRQGEYHKAKQAAVEVLKVDPKNLKGLLRAAKASLLDPASTLEEAGAALKAAEEEVTYKNPDEEKQLKQLKVQYKRKQQEYKRKTKAMFGNKLTNHNNGLSGKSSAPDGETASGSAATQEPANKTIAEAVEKAVTTLEEEEEARAEDDSRFWKKQMLQMVLQIVVPLGLYFLYRLVAQTDRIGEATLSVHEDASRMPEVDEVLDLD